jgi:hypothetical protein
MNDEDFEGTLVLEKLAEIGKLEAFYDAVDADDFAQVQKLMKRANIDSKTIAQVLRKMALSDDS